jgi:hypothetical protein
MTELDKQILQLMKSPTPPQTVKELVEACAPAKQATIFSKLSALLNSGELTRDELPWRKDQEARTKKGRPQKQKQKALEKKLEQWISEDGKDRVAAAKTLMELRMTGQEVTGPPPPNDKEGTIAALKQQLAAVGRDWATEAYEQLWPSEHAILVAGGENGETSTVGASAAS